MISIIASIVGAFLVGLYTPLLSPLVYVFRNKKRIFYSLFFFYCLLLSYEVKIPSVYYFSYDYRIIFAVIIPLILLLDEGLKIKHKRESVLELTLIICLLIGFVDFNVYTFTVIVALIYNFLDFSKKSALLIFGTLLFVFVGFITFKSVFGLIGSAVTQIVFLASISTLVAFFGWWYKKVISLPF